MNLEAALVAPLIEALRQRLPGLVQVEIP